MAVSSKVRVVDLAGRTFEKLTVTNAVKQLTTAKLGAGFFLTVEDDDIRYTIDGSTPDATTGHLLMDGQSLQTIDVTATANLKMIRVTTDAVIQVTHY